MVVQPQAVVAVSAPRRIQLTRKKGWRLPVGAVKVDRTTVFGNPFKAGESNGLGWGEVRDAAHAVWLYNRWLTTPSRSIVFELDRHDDIVRRLPALAGKDLACWCSSGAPCHADVLLELANRPNAAAWSEVVIAAADVPLTADEAATAMAQLGHALDIPASDTQRLAAALAELRRSGDRVPNLRTPDVRERGASTRED